MLQVCTQLLFSQLLTEREVAALHKPGAPSPMVLLIPHHVGGACGGEGEGKVMDFWHRTGPPGPNRQRARVEDMPWGNYNSIILHYILVVEDMPWGAGTKWDMCLWHLNFGREGTPG